MENAPSVWKSSYINKVVRNNCFLIHVFPLQLWFPQLFREYRPITAEVAFSRSDITFLKVRPSGKSWVHSSKRVDHFPHSIRPRLFHGSAEPNAPTVGRAWQDWLCSGAQFGSVSVFVGLEIWPVAIHQGVRQRTLRLEFSTFCCLKPRNHCRHLIWVHSFRHSKVMKTAKVKHASSIKGPSSALQNVIFFFTLKLCRLCMPCNGTEAAILVDHTQKVNSQKFAMRTVGWGIN